MTASTAGHATTCLKADAAATGSPGGASADTLNGGIGSDRLVGQGGNDRLTAVDGRRNSDDCGPGRDIAFVDRHDTVRR